MVESSWSEVQDSEVSVLENEYEESVEEDPDSLMLEYDGEIYEATSTGEGYKVEPFGGTLGSSQPHGGEKFVREVLEQFNYDSIDEMEGVVIQ
jgi:hypothetical protein